MIKNAKNTPEYHLDFIESNNFLTFLKLQGHGYIVNFEGLMNEEVVKLLSKRESIPEGLALGAA